MAAGEEIVFVPNVDVLDLVLNSSEEARHQSHERRFLELSICPRVRSGALTLVHGRVRLLLFQLLFLEQGLLLLEVLPNLFPLFFTVCFFSVSDYRLIFSFGPSYLMYNPMHQHNIRDLIVDVIFTSLWVTMKVVICGQVISIWSENEVDIL